MARLVGHGRPCAACDVVAVLGEMMLVSEWGSAENPSVSKGDGPYGT